MEILFFDIETSPHLIWSWGLYETNSLRVKETGKMISFAYKWQGKDKIGVHSLKNNTEKQLLIRLYELLNKADIVVGHNSKAFDTKMVNSFFVKHDIKPRKPYKQVDTLQIARSKFKFASNHLNDLGEYLGVGSKVKTGGIDLWFQCMAGNRKSWNLMEKYNKQDVALLEKVYNRLVPWIENYPSTEVGMFCPKCGGDTQFRGPYVSKKYIGKRYQCKNCGSWGISNKKYKINKEEYIQ